MQYNTIQCNAMQCTVLQRNATQHYTIKYNTIQYNTIHYIIDRLVHTFAIGLPSVFYSEKLNFFLVLLTGFELWSWNVQSAALPTEPPRHPILWERVTYATLSAKRGTKSWGRSFHPPSSYSPLSPPSPPPPSPSPPPPPPPSGENTTQESFYLLF